MQSKFRFLYLALLALGCSSKADDPSETSSAAVTTFPCAIDRILDAKCRTCHADGGQVGTPFQFTSPEVLYQPGRLPGDGSKLLGSIMSERIHHVDGQNPMPPLNMPQLDPGELALLDSWLSQGAPPGASCNGGGGGGAPNGGGQPGYGGSVPGGGQPSYGGSIPGGGATGSGGIVGGGATSNGTGGTPPSDGDGGTYVPVDPNDCDTVEVRARADGSGTPFPVPVGTSELYQCFSYNIPPTATNQAISFKPLIDNPAVIHHWLLYKMSTPQTNGITSPCLGSHLDGQLLAGWAPGAGEWTLPADVGVDLGSGNFLLEIHYNNYGTTNETDRSGVEVCRAKVARKNTATISWLGNDTFGFATPGIPPLTQDAPIVGACKPNITTPIHILKSWPHMHKHGRRMDAEIHRADGTIEPLFDKPFDFNSQIQYDTPAILNTGDWIKTTCHFNNDTVGTIGFGEATTVEMCYNFTLAYPPNSLIAGIGVHSNVCLGQP
ncbi:MAG TPA: hypothetical protein VHE30_29705 [Polyangiaceae bacterium]|nr:hypothetical protein [Polyangiaceae bacterium]